MGEEEERKYVLKKMTLQKLFICGNLKSSKVDKIGRALIVIM